MSMTKLVLRICPYIYIRRTSNEVYTAVTQLVSTTTISFGYGKNWSLTRSTSDCKSEPPWNVGTQTVAFLFGSKSAVSVSLTFEAALLERLREKGLKETKL